MCEDSACAWEGTSHDERRYATSREDTKSRNLLGGLGIPRCAGGADSVHPLPILLGDRRFAYARRGALSRSIALAPADHSGSLSGAVWRAGLHYSHKKFFSRSRNDDNFLPVRRNPRRLRAGAPRVQRQGPHHGVHPGRDDVSADLYCKPALSAAPIPAPDRHVSRPHHAVHDLRDAAHGLGSHRIHSTGPQGSRRSRARGRRHAQAELHEDPAPPRGAEPGDDRNSDVHLLLERVSIRALLHARPGEANGAGSDRAVSWAIPGALGGDSCGSGGGYRAGGGDGFDIPTADRAGTDGGSSQRMKTTTDFGPTALLTNCGLGDLLRTTD